MTTSRIYIIAGLLLLARLAHAQVTGRYFFSRHTSASGLAANEVNDVVQDPEGFIWIATTGGLQRYDGVRFTSFRNQKNNPSTLPGNVVSDLQVDRAGHLWVQVMGNRVGTFDIHSFRFREAAIKPSKPEMINSDKRFSVDEQGNLMMVLWNNELLTYNPNRNEFSPAANFIYVPAGWKVTGVCQIPGTSRYIVGTMTGMAIYNRKTERLSYAGHNLDQDPLVDKIGKITMASNLLIDHKGRLWFDTWENGSSTVVCYDLARQSLILDHYNFYKLVSSYYELGGVIEQRSGDIWIKGLNIFAHFLEDSKTFELVHNGFENEQSIAYNRVNSLFEDRDRNIWVGTDINGMFRFNPTEQYFTNIRQINRNTGKPGNGGSMSFMQLNNGDIFVGTWEDGLYRFDSNFNMKPLGVAHIGGPGPSMWGMYASHDGHTIWMGAQPGIWRVDQSTNSSVFYHPKLAENRTIRQVAEDKFGNLWMGTQSLGIFKWTASRGKKNFDDGMALFTRIPPCMTTRIMTDSRGWVWITTTSLGVYAIDPATDSVVVHLSSQEAEPYKLNWDAVASVIQYDDTTMIVAANSLVIYNTALKRITRTLTFPDVVAGSVSSVERDNNGYVWMSTTDGIFRVNIRSRIFIRFDRADGIGNDRFIVAASYKLANGKMLFGADNQFICFDPAAVRINNIAPEVRITGIKLANQSLPADSVVRSGVLELTPKENSVTIEFAGLQYTAAYLIRYRLEGLDKEWRVADRNFQAVYSYLPAGTYTLELQSADAENRPGNQITRLLIHVHPPFWKTWWFYCILALVVAAIVYWLDKQRVNRLVALQNVRSEIAVNLHEEVNTTLNNINLLSEMARIKADKDIDRSKEFIEQISQKSHNMIEAMDDILWSIDPKNDSMERSLLRMMEWADAMKNQFGGQVELALDKRIRTLRLDMKTRHDLFLIFKESLRLMIAHAGGRETLVHVDLFKNKLSMRVQDATAALDKNVQAIESSIRIINEKAALINADVDVQSEKNGITILLLVPVK